MRLEMGRDHTLFIHVTLVPFIDTTGELKTKPAQHSVKELRGIGIQPDILLCRTERPLTHEVKAKIAMFCNVEEEAVITARNVASIYEVPLAVADEKLDEQILTRLRLAAAPGDLSGWRELVHRIHHPADTVRIGVVGKYVQLHDSYKSLGEALVHGGLAHNLRTEILWIESEGLEQADDWRQQLQGLDAILVPGGFGRRGIPGMLNAIRYARENKIPYFGICLGMQCAVIEFARNVCGLDDADSTEFNPATPHRTYVEIVELADHPWFLGCQFHPEFKSKPFDPHPLFKAFVGAAYQNRLAKEAKEAQEGKEQAALPAGASAKVGRKSA